jgi:transcriptional regulator with XRE-family HTH domain
VKFLRKDRGWSQAELARRLAEAGAEELDRGVLANLETGRRQSVSVDELLVLALVLDTAPVHLLVPIENAEPVKIGRREFRAGSVREWVRGLYPLPPQDPKRYRTNVPDDEWAAFEYARPIRPRKVPRTDIEEGA